MVWEQDCTGIAGVAWLARCAGSALEAPVEVLQRDLQVLQDHDERLTRYLAAVHHQPLTMQLQLLRESLRIDRVVAELPALRQEMWNATQRAADIGAGLQRPLPPPAQPPERVELVELLEHAIHWAGSAEDMPCALEVQAPQPCTVAGSRAELLQLLMNLLQNACEAGAAKGQVPRVTLALQRVGAQAELQVTDNGPGIPPEHLPQLFEPFFTTREPGQGIGLGLWSSQLVARQHGGTLEAANAAGGGAVLTLKLPLATP